MDNMVYHFRLKLDWQLMELINRIERFDTSWISLEKREEQRLNILRTLATISSVGASTRIEGSQLGDNEVEELLNNLDITKTERQRFSRSCGLFQCFGLDH